VSDLVITTIMMATPQSRLSYNHLLKAPRRERQGLEEEEGDEERWIYQCFP